MTETTDSRGVWLAVLFYLATTPLVASLAWDPSPYHTIPLEASTIILLVWLTPVPAFSLALYYAEIKETPTETD